MLGLLETGEFTSPSFFFSSGLGLRSSCARIPAPARAPTIRPAFPNLLACAIRPGIPSLVRNRTVEAITFTVDLIANPNFVPKRTNAPNIAGHQSFRKRVSDLTLFLFAGSANHFSIFVTAFPNNVKRMNLRMVSKTLLIGAKIAENALDIFLPLDSSRFSLSLLSFSSCSFLSSSTFFLSKRCSALRASRILSTDLPIKLSIPNISSQQLQQLLLLLIFRLGNILFLLIFIRVGACSVGCVDCGGCGCVCGGGCCLFFVGLGCWAVSFSSCLSLNKNSSISSIKFGFGFLFGLFEEFFAILFILFS